MYNIVVTRYLASYGPLILLCQVDGDDFNNTRGTVTFPSGSTAGEMICKSFRIIDDGIQEIDEHFIVTASREDLFSNSIATVVIQDNDGKCLQIEDKKDSYS